MNKAALIEKLAKKMGISRKEAEAMVELFTEIVTETLQNGDEVTISGFGTFLPRFRSARMGVDPQNPTQRIKIPAITIPKFKAGKTLKDALKKKKPIEGSNEEDKTQTPAMGPEEIAAQIENKK